MAMAVAGYGASRTVAACAQSDNGDVPRPLHVTKRSALEGGDRIARHARGCSPASDQSDATMDSPPGPPGGCRPLTLPKRRGGRGGWTMCHPVGCAWDGTADERAVTPLADPAALERPRSESCMSSHQSNSRIPYGSPPHRKSNPVRSGPRQVLAGVVDHDSTHGWANPARRATPEDDRDQDSSFRKNAQSMFNLSQSLPGTRSLSLPGQCVLAPSIVVTPEYRVVDEGVATVWAAVELSTQVCLVDSDGWYHGAATDGQPSPDVLQYGYLYDVSIEILPTSKSTIVEVLDGKAYTKTLHPGTRLLFVTHIRLQPAARRLGHSHVRQNSDKLIEDLEHQLGGTVTEYVQVRLTYRHSGFPQSHLQTPVAAQTTAPDGLSSFHTVLQTTAVATIKRRNAASPWSPPPIIQRPNPLFQVIASHWGSENAHAVMQRAIRSQSVASETDAAPSSLSLIRHPPVLDFLSFLAGSKQQAKDDDVLAREAHMRPLETGQEYKSKTPSPHARPAPSIPRRQASLRCVAAPLAAGQRQSEENDALSTLQGTTVRRKRYRSIRRAASFFQQASSSPSGPPPSSSSSSSPPLPTLKPMRRGSSKDRPGADAQSCCPSLAAAGAETEKQRGFRGRWSEGAEAALTSLTPVVVNVRLDGDGQARELAAGVAGQTGGGSVKARRGKGKKEGGWWAGWWQ